MQYFSWERKTGKILQAQKGTKMWFVCQKMLKTFFIVDETSRR